jgi:hypothetical protein
MGFHKSGNTWSLNSGELTCNDLNSGEVPGNDLNNGEVTGNA